MRFPLAMLLALLAGLSAGAQGFGSFTHDQPFLARDSAGAASTLEDLLTQQAYLRWTWLDLASNATVSAWTNRIGPSVSFINADATKRPETTASGLKIDINNFLTNAVFEMKTNMAFGFIFKVIDPLDSGAGDSPIWAGSGKANEDESITTNSWGFRFGGGSSSLEWEVPANTVWTGPRFGQLTNILVAVIHSFGVDLQSNTNYVALWTNSVLSKGVGGPASLLVGGCNDKRAPISLGHSYYRNSGPEMYLLDIWVWTNQPTGSEGLVLSAQTRSNFFAFMTNSYPQ